jgi:hypothetical protein
MKNETKDRRPDVEEIAPGVVLSMKRNIIIPPASKNIRLRLRGINQITFIRGNIGVIVNLTDIDFFRQAFNSLKNFDLSRLDFIGPVSIIGDRVSAPGQQFPNVFRPKIMAAADNNEISSRCFQSYPFQLLHHDLISLA